MSSGMWTNLSQEYSMKYMGKEKYDKFKNKKTDIDTVSCLTNFWGRSGLSLASRNASSMVKEKRCNMSSFLLRNHAVGAVGYAYVCPRNKNNNSNNNNRNNNNSNNNLSDQPIITNDFFTEGNRYRVRFRHSNIYLDNKMNCEVCDDDDASSCIREAAIKFGDQKRDGPFNLILFTGRTSLAANSIEFNKLLRINDKEKWRRACLENPNLYFALVDGLRKDPESFAYLTYYSQIVYLHEIDENSPNNQKQRRLVKFRLVPEDYPEYKMMDSGEFFDHNVYPKETGMLDEMEQHRPWETKRSPECDRSYRYLVNDFKQKLFDKNDLVRYRLQFQSLKYDEDPKKFNPQMIWDESKYMWTDLMVIELTTYLTRREFKKTYFNICDIPKSLSFPMASSDDDYLSLQKVLISVYTKLERRNISQISECGGYKRATTAADKDRFTTYRVEVTSQALMSNEVIPNVDIYIQLLGVKGRTGCHVLDELEIGRLDQVQRRRTDVCDIVCERVGELIAIIVDVEYRSLSDDFYLSNIKITYTDINDLLVCNIFPSYQIITSNIFLPSGEVYLVQKQTDSVMERERKLELHNRSIEFTWRPPDSKIDKLPGRIMCDLNRLESLPVQVRTISSRYTGLRWEVDPDIIDFFREFRSSITTVKTQGIFPKSKKTIENVDSKKIGSVTTNKAVLGNSRNNKVLEPILGGMQGSKLNYNNSTIRNFYKLVIDNKKSSGIAESDLKAYEEEIEDDADDVDENEGLPTPDLVSPEELNDTIFMTPAVEIQESNIASPLPSTAEQRKSALKQLHLVDSVSEDTTDGVKKQARLSYLIKKHKDEIKRMTSPLDRQMLPDGPMGDMCLRLEKDDVFANMFLVGGNPTMIKQCKKIPDKFNLKRDKINHLLNRSKNLDIEAMNGHVFIVDYKLLHKVQTFSKDSDSRYICAPIVLLYQNEKELIPLAIQLHQDSNSYVWTVSGSSPLQWINVKMWVACVDFNYQFAIAHLFNCHLLMEPFAVATFRLLPVAHPVYKLLAPHFKNLIFANVMIWKNVLSPDGSVDRHCSLGRSGFLQLMARYWETFDFRTLNPEFDASSRGVKGLSKYYYRDDVIRLYKKCFKPYCLKILKFYYKTDEDLNEDSELITWVNELNAIGFPTVGYCLRKEQTIGNDPEKIEVVTTKNGGFPQKITRIVDLADLLASVIFTVTCQHSATHFDAMDIFGFVPDIPAAMHMEPPVNKRDSATKDLLSKTLPDQYPEAYYGSLAFIMNNHKPDQNIISTCKEIHFVEEEAVKIVDEFKRHLNELTTSHRARNIIEGYNYENLIPSFILNSPEALPFVPYEILNKTLKDLGPTLTKAIFLSNVATGSLPYNSLALPVCMQFDKVLGGRSIRGTKKKIGIFNKSNLLTTRESSMLGKRNMERRTSYLKKESNDHLRIFVRQNTVS